MIRYLLFGFTCLLSYSLPAQRTNPVYPRGYFNWPLKLDPSIVANMGELRPNHWHMGLDIRTAQKVNQPVYAAADGYIAYVGIRSSSYGRFIIINHPNGLSTLYGHLNDFAPALETYVTQQQYQQESWASELDIPKDKFPVSKGNLIAYSGTTGASQGPHVHFEIRDTKTQKCLNPLLFGMPLADNTAPVMVRLAMYDGDNGFYKQYPAVFKLKNTPAGYIIPGVSLYKTGLRKISFGIEAFDRMNGSANQDGIYAARLFFDDRLQGEFIIDSIGYNDTRYVNAQVDYEYQAIKNISFQHLSLLPGDHSNVFHMAEGNGVITLVDNDAHNIRIEIKDAYGNSSLLNFQVQHDESIILGERIWGAGDMVIPNQITTIEKPDFEAVFSPNSIYDTLTAIYSRANSAETYAVSAKHTLGTELFPVHDNITIRIKPDKIIPDEWKNKIVIRRTGDNTNFRTAQWQGNWLTATFNAFGSFQAFADITPPSIGELAKGDTVNLSGATRIIFTANDNSGIKNFRAELDGQWLRFTNDKSRSWIYIFDERCPYGVHELSVRVEDLAGNVTTKKWWFKKYAYTAPPKKTKAKKKTATKKKAISKKKK